jgi:hypothetical protein
MRAAAMFAQLAVSRGHSYGATAVSGGQPVLSAPVLTALPAGTPGPSQGQPYYEPGYEGPQRYLGAPRATGTGPMPRASTGPLPLTSAGSMPLTSTGPMPRVPTGPFPASPGQLPPYASGPMPRVPTGPFPASPGQLPPYASGPMPRVPVGPRPPGMGPVPPSAISGPLPVPPYASGPYPVADTTPFPPYPSGPPPYIPNGPGTGPSPQFRPPTGPMPRAATGPLPLAGDGRPAAWDAGPQHRSQAGPMPRPAGGPYRGGGTGPMSPQQGPRPWPATGPLPQVGGVMPPARSDGGGWQAGPGWPGSQGRQAASRDAGRYPAEPPWDDLQQTDPNLRYREPGPGMPGYRGSREHRYGGDAR